jgi:prepilin-type N-terminal cleavage/methylation domain-containing protein
MMHRDQKLLLPCLLGRRPRRGKPDGFSILELMVAMMVLLIGFMTMMQLIATSVVVNQRSTNLSSLTQLAAEKVEQLRAESLGDPDFGVAGNPQFASATATSLGSLTTDDTETLPDSSGNSHTVSFYDYITINGRDGSITRVEGLDDTGRYQTVVRSLGGVTTTSASRYAPTTKTYVRRWKIEPYTNINNNQVMAGAYRITVNLSLPSVTGSVSFRPMIQLQSVR